MEYHVIENVKRRYNNRKTTVCIHTGAIYMQICRCVTHDKSSYRFFLDIVSSVGQQLLKDVWRMISLPCGFQTKTREIGAALRELWTQELSFFFYMFVKSPDQETEQELLWINGAKGCCAHSSTRQRNEVSINGLCHTDTKTRSSDYVSWYQVYLMWWWSLALTTSPFEGLLQWIRKRTQTNVTTNIH